MWRIGDQAALSRIEQALAPHQALIADGHHRYATYPELRDGLRSTEGAGPWDHGLALLIDQSQSPLQLGAIHRSIAELSLSDVHVPEGCRWTRLPKCRSAVRPLRTDPAVS